jgi:hypothetical protein
MRHWLLGLLMSAALAAPAMADGVCKGPTPAPGMTLHGPVLQIDDGASLCIGLGAHPSAWSLVRLRAVHTPRATLMAAAFGKNAVCAIGRDGLAVCTVEGRPLAGELQRPELLRTALEWR